MVFDSLLEEAIKDLYLMKEGIIPKVREIELYEPEPTGDEDDDFVDEDDIDNNDSFIEEDTQDIDNDNDNENDEELDSENDEFSKFSNNMG